MKTAYKILIAKSLLKLISYFSSSLNINCTRNKINWTLDLNEGIDLSIFIFGKFEYEIIKTVEKLHLVDNSNSSILDIGANIGLFAHRAEVRGASKVISIEPLTPTFNCLIKNALGESQYIRHQESNKKNE